jgi:hypothetical protein
MGQVACAGILPCAPLRPKALDQHDALTTDYLADETFLHNKESIT